ncbi:MAG: DUF488 family protein [Desulfovibrio sp.]|uniref:DUF488 domain-containing protein n=1 Tax=Desulfovibrio sp. TaxID=885 RepID=UPI0039E3AE42
MNITLQRVYDHTSTDSGGIRILVDRIWPRGISKAAASWDVWLKEVAPSNELRKWFAHDRDKWDAFQQRYFAELAAPGPASSAVDDLKKIIADNGTVVFLYAAKDELCNNAVALKEYMEALPGRGGESAKG